MLAVSDKKDESRVRRNRVGTAVSDVGRNDGPPGRAAGGSDEIIWMRRVRRGKVMAVRRKLAEGKYDLNRRLRGAIDKIIKDVGPGPGHRNH
ncbi:MAG: hypothetical protein JSU70_21575 [Phycisphaerales bacterium]|nr:MAG: hypothetical protein JSU70_21575 [Phycisphaerales bacterium]